MTPKRICSLLLAVCMTVALFPSMAWATQSGAASAASESILSESTAASAGAENGASSAASTSAESGASSAASASAENGASSAATSASTESGASTSASAESGATSAATAPVPALFSAPAANGATRAAPVAEIVGGNSYTSVQAAYDAAPNNATIKLLANVTEAIVVERNSFTVTLDLNGKTLKSPIISSYSFGTISCKGYNVLTVKDTAPGGTGCISNSNGAVAIRISEGSKVNLEGGTVTTTDDGVPISIFKNSKFTMSGGTVKAGPTSICAIILSEAGATATIKGGIISSQTAGINCTGTLDVSGSATIKGGTDDGIVTYGTGSITISGSGPTISGGKNAIHGTVAVGSSYANPKIMASTDQYGFTPAPTEISLAELNAANSYRYVKFGQATADVAEIVDGGKYETVQEAFDAAAASATPATVRLLANVTESVITKGTNAITLELNGKKLTASAGADYAIFHNCAGALTIQDTPGGGCVSKGGTGGDTITLSSQGTFNLASGTVESTASASNAIQVSTIAGTSKATISGGTISSPKTGILCLGTLEISGNAVIKGASDYGISNFGSVTISGSGPTISGGKKAISGTVAVGSSYANPKIMASADINGTSPAPTEIMLAALNAANSYQYVKFEQGTAKVAEIGSTPYATVQAAFDAVKNGETVKLLADVTENVTTSGANDITLDLNGKTLASALDISKTTITHSGSGALTIQDTATGGKGCVSSDKAAAIKLTFTGAFNLDSGTVKTTASNKSAIETSDAAASMITISGGKVEAGVGYSYSISTRAGTDVTVTGGTISSPYIGISCSGALKVSGDTTVIKGTSDYGINLSTGGSITISGSGPTISGGKKAINGTVAVGSSYANPKIMASADINGTSPAPTEISLTELNKANSYQYVKFEQGTAKVAEIVGGQKYETVQAAFDAVKNGTAAATVKLLADVTESVTTGGANAITLDLNGKTLTPSIPNNTTITHSGSGALTIQDTATGGCVSSDKARAILLTSTGEFTLASGTVKTTALNEHAIETSGAAANKITIKGGNVEAGTGSLYSIFARAGTDVTVTGGTISSSSAGIRCDGKLDVSGNTTVIKGTSQYGIYILNGGSVTISGSGPTICGGAKAINGTVAVDASYTTPKIMASDDITGTGAAAITLAKLNATNSYQYVKFEQGTAAGVAEIGSTPYATVQAAFDAVKNGTAAATVKLLADVTESVTTGGANAITLELNGKTLTSSIPDKATITHSGSGALTIQDTKGGGCVSSNKAGAISLTSTGAFNLLSGTVKTTAQKAYTITSTSTATGKITISGGTVEAGTGSYYSIYTMADTEVTVTGGTISSSYCGILCSGKLDVSGNTTVIKGASEYGIYALASDNVTISGSGPTISGDKRAIMGPVGIDQKSYANPKIMVSGDINGTGAAEITLAELNTPNSHKYVKFEQSAPPVVNAVSGTVTTKTNTTDVAVSGATVMLVQGKDKKYETKTDSSGKYGFLTVAQGLYNIVVIDSNSITITDSIAMEDKPIVKDMRFLGSSKNTVVEVTPGTPEVTVGGMNNLLNAENIGKTLTEAQVNAVTGGGSVELKFTATGKTASEVAADKSLLDAAAGAQKIDLLLDLSVQRTVKDDAGNPVGTAGEKISELASVLTANLSLPSSLHGKADLTVYRVHNGKAQAIQKDTPDANGEYFTLNASQTVITLHVKSFSTYAVATNASAPASSSTAPASSSSAPASAGTATLPQYTITATAGPGGSLSTGRTVVVFEGESAGFSILPSKGYQIADVVVNGKSIGAKNGYVFTNIRANQTIHATFKQAGHTNPQTGVAFEEAFLK